MSNFFFVDERLPEEFKTRRYLIDFIDATPQTRAQREYVAHQQGSHGLFVNDKGEHIPVGNINALFNTTGECNGFLVEKEKWQKWREDIIKRKRVCRNRRILLVTCLGFYALSMFLDPFFGRPPLAIGMATMFLPFLLLRFLVHDQ